MPGRLAVLVYGDEDDLADFHDQPLGLQLTHLAADGNADARGAGHLHADLDDVAEIGRGDFVYWDTDGNDWAVEAGDFELLLGASSEDIRLRATLRVR